MVIIHPTATVEKTAKIGAGTKIWHYAHVRDGAVIGTNCVVGHCAYIGKNVKMGGNVKIGNKVSVFQGVTIQDDVFIGPHVAFTNDLRPRSRGDWKLEKTLVKRGASIGTNSTIICGVTIGAYAMIGAGSVVTHDVPDHGLAYGNPSKPRGFVCFCGEPLIKYSATKGGYTMLRCKKCRKVIKISGV